MKADLHTHTTASDGRVEPQRLVEMVHERGLKAFSITDHDTLDGYWKAVDRARELEMELIPGIENTVIWEGKEVHLLAYYFDPGHPAIVRFVAGQKRARRDRMKRIVSVLQSQGVDITMDEVMAEAFGGNVGRPHAAAVLIQKRIVGSVAEAFVRFLDQDKLNVQTEYASLEATVDVFKAAGGVVSLAHPGRMYSVGEVARLTECEVDALECIHPSHPFLVMKRLVALAERAGKLITGGSDFHGKNGDGYDPFLGIVTLSGQHLSKIRALSDQRKQQYAGSPDVSTSP